MTTWSELSDAQQCDVISRVQAGEDRAKVALAFGLKPTSLDRKLRKLRAQGVIDNYITAQAEVEDAAARSSFTVDGNEASLEWSTGSGPIQTLEALVASHQIDLDVWVQHGPVTHNTWTTPRARRDADGFEYFQNHQVKAQFVKRQPEPVFPVLQPVTVATRYQPPPPPPTDGLGLSYIFADPHFGYLKDLKTARLTPFHHRPTLDLHLQLIAALQPDRVDVLGDWLDMTEWTDRFLRSPEFYWTTQPALLESAWWLGQIRELVPHARIALHQGNHDKRMDDAVKAHLPAAYDLKAVDELDLPPALSLPKLLALHRLQVEWVGDYPNDQAWVNNLVVLEHGDRALSPGMTARAVAKESHEVHAFGHIHRFELVSKTLRPRGTTQVVTSFSPACSCWIDGRVPGSSPKSQWQNGGGLIEYEVDGAGYNLTPIVMDQGRCFFRGQRFTGRDRVDEIRSAMDGWQI